MITRQVDKIDHIIKEGNVYAIDYFPKHIDRINYVKEFDNFCKKRILVRDYIKRMSHVFMKISAFYDVFVWLGEDSKVKLRKYPNRMLGSQCTLSDKIKIINKMLYKGHSVSLLLEPINAVIILDVHNSGLHMLETIDVNFIQKIIESEGLFLWESPH